MRRLIPFPVPALPLRALLLPALLAVALPPSAASTAPPQAVAARAPASTPTGPTRPAIADARADGRRTRHAIATHDRYIVRFASDDAAPSPRGRAALDRAARHAGVSARLAHRIGVGDRWVFRTSRRLREDQAQAFLNRLRQDPAIASVDRDRRLRAAMTPNDPLFAQQWHLGEGLQGNGGIRAPTAWDQATGQGILVAVVDTGITVHPDLAGRVVAGRDFVSDLPTAGDGDGRDSDPTDPGDWNDAGQCEPDGGARPSSWHGTAMAGIITAATNNATGIAGVAFGAQVMPLRALGHCGGWSTDVADAIRWAAGGAVAGTPVNPMPVDVVNLSLGGEEPCISPLQDAIDYARAAGVAVVVSAGNAGADARAYAPANCRGVVVVGATDGWGERTWYSNFGPVVDLSGPGGGGSFGVYAPANDGATVPALPIYAQMTGTSPAAANVSGIAALVQSVAPTTPENLEAILTATARRLLIPCLRELCGAGLANASAAVTAAIDGALSVGDARLAEGNDGDTLVTFEVRLSRAMPMPVSFNVATADGAFPEGIAQAGTDFAPLTLVGEVLPPGVTSRRYSVRVFGDVQPEPDETFRVQLANVQGVAIARGEATILVKNDDAIPLVRGVTTAQVSSNLTGSERLYAIEVPAGATALRFEWVLEGGTVSLYARHGLPPEPWKDNDCWVEDWWGGGWCEFATPAPGTWYFLVQTYDYLKLSLGANYISAAPPVLAVGDATAPEGDVGDASLAFPLRLSGVSAADISVTVSTGAGTATAGQDFVALGPTTVTIPAGQTSVVVPVLMHGDTSVEDNESLTLDLRDVQGASLARTQARGRIANDDRALLSIDDLQLVESDGATTASFTVVLSEAMPNPVTYDVRTVDGSATAGTDFVARRLTGRFLDAGRTRQAFEVTLLGDDLAEAQESFSVLVDNVAGATLGDGGATATVADDDDAQATRPRAATQAQRLRGSGVQP